MRPERKQDLDTPFLWVDLERLEANIAELVSHFSRADVGWRPHMKGIKVPAIAKLAVEAGAIGVTCAKLSEAELMADSGVTDILIANQVVGPLKVPRLAALQHKARVMVAVDNLENAAELAAAARTAGVKIGVLVEVDVGMQRAGVPPGEPVLALAEALCELTDLQFEGLMGWEGHTVGITDPREKQDAVKAALGRLHQSVLLCRDAGVPVRIVSGGGSGDYTISARLGILTEIQAGGAIFCDATYLAFGATTRPSLFVRTMVSSRPTPERIIFDAGFKALPAHPRPPVPIGLPPAARSYRPSAEHGTLILEQPDRSIRIGDAFDFIVGYGDATVFLHDRLYGIRGDRVERVWQIEGRGKLT